MNVRSVGAIVLSAVAACVSGCGVESPFGFRLPEGDAAAGREAFVALRCNACHEIVGGDVEHLGGAARVSIGGKTTRIKTYGELVTSIINPSHRIAPPNREAGAAEGGESLMSYAYLNDVMTVQQLVDLVAFLHPTYELVMPPPARWAMYQ